MGFPSSSTKKFSAKLIPILKDVFAEMLEQGTLPPTMTQAIISVLHKKDKDHLKCDSFQTTFPLHRGTRQGCPPSPLLFDIAIEPLAIAIRKEAGLMGFNRDGHIQKVLLYDDYLILYLSEPDSSVSKALDIISKFRKVSGYKINLSKSIIFPINGLAQQLDFNLFPFKVARDRFPYLGVSVTHKFSDLFKYNMLPALEKAKQDLNRCQSFLSR